MSDLTLAWAMELEDRLASLRASHAAMLAAAKEALLCIVSNIADTTSGEKTAKMLIASIAAADRDSIGELYNMTRAAPYLCATIASAEKLKP